MQVLERIKEDGIRFVNLQFSDILGVIKEIIIPVKELENALKKGVWFDGSSIEGFARIQESDMFLRPDPKTYTKIPWLEDTARFICDVCGSSGKPFEGDPRSILKKTLSETRYDFKVGPELEFYLFRQGEPVDESSYFEAPSEEGRKVLREAISYLEGMGIDAEASHHEVGKGQYEIDVKYDSALRIADSVMTSKYVVKAVAQKYGLKATFMPKPIFGAPGSGMHVHQSLFEGEENLFYDERDRYNLSRLAYHFIAGQMEHIKAMCAVVSPTVNSYKRLISGFEAPVYITWARMNRSALIRVPKWFDEKSARIELRCPDPSCNPYLAFTVMLAAGLDGIKKKLEPPEPVEENIYALNEEDRKYKHIDTLPSSLHEALIELEKDEVIQKALGGLHRRYVEIKRREWNEFKFQVTSWELEKYMGMH